MTKPTDTTVRLFCGLIGAFIAYGLAVPAVAATLDADLLNATTNAVGDDPAGLSTGFSASSQVNALETIEDAFGNKDGGVEGTTFIFANGRTPDNGNAVMGDGGESVDNITWSTTSADRANPCG